MSNVSNVLSIVASIISIVAAIVLPFLAVTPSPQPPPPNQVASAPRVSETPTTSGTVSQPVDLKVPEDKDGQSSLRYDIGSVAMYYGHNITRAELLFGNRRRVTFVGYLAYIGEEESDRLVRKESRPFTLFLEMNPPSALASGPPPFVDPGYRNNALAICEFDDPIQLPTSIARIAVTGEIVPGSYLSEQKWSTWKTVITGQPPSEQKYYIPPLIRLQKCAYSIERDFTREAKDSVDRNTATQLRTMLYVAPLTLILALTTALFAAVRRARRIERFGKSVDQFGPIGIGMAWFSGICILSFAASTLVVESFVLEPKQSANAQYLREIDAQQLYRRP